MFYKLKYWFGILQKIGIKIQGDILFYFRVLTEDSISHVTFCGAPGECFPPAGALFISCSSISDLVLLSN